jgi:hypothetical protein
MNYKKKIKIKNSLQHDTLSIDPSLKNIANNRGLTAAKSETSNDCMSSYIKKKIRLILILFLSLNN